MGRVKAAYRDHVSRSGRSPSPNSKTVVRLTGFMECHLGLPDHSALMLAARITLPHFSLSSAMNWPKSAGEPGSAVAPSSAIRALILGSANAALISLLSLSTISVGMFLGAPMPNQALAS